MQPAKLKTPHNKIGTGQRANDLRRSGSRSEGLAGSREEFNRQILTADFSDFADEKKKIRVTRQIGGSLLGLRFGCA